MKLNSTNTNQNSNDTISNSNNVEDSEQTTSNTDLYSKIREPIRILFIFLLIGIIVIFFHSCMTLNEKFEILMSYFYITADIDRVEYKDTTRSELTNLDKNFLDSVKSYDWGLARYFLERIDIIDSRSKKERRINPSVSSTNESTETKQ